MLNSGMFITEEILETWILKYQPLVPFTIVALLWLEVKSSHFPLDYHIIVDVLSHIFIKGGRVELFKSPPLNHLSYKYIDHKHHHSNWNCLEPRSDRGELRLLTTAFLIAPRIELLECGWWMGEDERLGDRGGREMSSFTNSSSGTRDRNLVTAFNRALRSSSSVFMWLFNLDSFVCRLWMVISRLLWWLCMCWIFSNSSMFCCFRLRLASSVFWYMSDSPLWGEKSISSRRTWYSTSYAWSCLLISNSNTWANKEKRNLENTWKKRIHGTGIYFR